MNFRILFCFAVCGLLNQGSAQTDNLKKFAFEDIYNSKFQSKGFSLKWSGTGDTFTYKKDGGIVSVDPADPSKETPLFTKEALEKYSFSEINSDLTKVLGGFDVKQKWRHSITAKYKIISKEGADVDVHTETLDFAGWSPDGKALSYVHNGGLFISNNLANPTAGQITVAAAGNKFNGIPDWLYEEEILGSRVSHYWSPDSSKICYASIDDAGIGSQSWIVYGDKDNVVETIETIKYPKAGLEVAPTSKVTLHVATIDWTGTKVDTVKLNPPADLAALDHYFLQVQWINNAKVFVTWSNRIQTKAYHTYYHLTGTALELEPTKMYDEPEGGDTLEGWIQVPPVRPIFPSDDEKVMITVKAHKPKDSKVTWRHLAHFSGDPLTGKYLLDTQTEVSSLLKVVGDDVYFIQTGKDSTERKLFKKNLKDETVKEIKVPDSCHYLSASFSPTGTYFLRTCHGPDVPSYTLTSTKEDYKEQVYQDNNLLKTSMKEKDLVTKEYIRLDNLYIELYKPAVKSGRKLPLLVSTYAGPGTQDVSERFDGGSTKANWLWHMASFYDVAIASIDGRGTIGNGEELKMQMYKNMGVVEVEDQIKGIKELAKRDDIDEKNVAIFGWSYGGFTAASVLADSKDVKCGLSVAPVTNEALYDTAYTERYLGLFKDNKEVYGKTSLQNKAAKFANKKFLVAHGTADDNVHFTNYAHLIKELEKNDILFTQLTYPDEAHGINRLNKHLFHSLTHFLVTECFAAEEPKSLASLPSGGVFNFILPFLVFLLAKYVF